jgi:hypothetical protein
MSARHATIERKAISFIGKRRDKGVAYLMIRGIQLKLSDDYELKKN